MNESLQKILDAIKANPTETKFKAEKGEDDVIVGVSIPETIDDLIALADRDIGPKVEKLEIEILGEVSSPAGIRVIAHNKDGRRAAREYRFP
jgi:hypothetical protein